MENKRKSVGIIILAKDTNKFLLLHRTKNPVAWSSLAGKMEDGETPKETIKREIQEEIGIKSTILSDIEEVGMVGSHHVMLGIVDKQFNITNLKKMKMTIMVGLPKKLYPHQCIQDGMKLLNL